MGKYLFTPLAVSAALALMASYVVSRTVSPLCCSRLLRVRTEREHFPRTLFVAAVIAAVLGAAIWIAIAWTPLPHSLSWNAPTIVWLLRLAGTAFVVGGAVTAFALLFWVSPRFERLFERLTGIYHRALQFCLRRRLAIVAIVLVSGVFAFGALRQIGQELFPEVDAGEFTIHMRVAGGPRVEQTEREVAAIEKMIRGEPEKNIPGVVADEDLEMILSNVGLSSRWSAIYSPNNGPHAAAIRVQLRSGFAGRRTSTAAYVERLRRRLAVEFPGSDFFIESGGMIRRILNADAVAPIEVQIHGRNDEERRAFARKLHSRLSRLPDVKDTYLPQGMELPQLLIKVDRRQAMQQFGFTDLDVMRSVFTALMSSAQIAPNLWIDRQSGNHYLIGVQFPEETVRTLQSLEDIPISAERNRPGAGNVRKLKELATIERTQGPMEIYRQTGEPVSQLFLNVAGNDLRVASETVRQLSSELFLDFALGNLPPTKVQLAEDETFKQRLGEYFRFNHRSARGDIRKTYGIDPEALKKSLRVEVRGEVASMSNSFNQMAFSLSLAILLVYLVMAAQFSSWLDPLIMIVSAPLGLIGVALALWTTDTSLNIQSCMGVLMMIGISVSNSVLLVEFANRERARGLGAKDAVLSAAQVRLRPIVMTTLATVVGLLPMALHLRPGDEMNLPLARAVIGGLLGSTALTLFVVPVLYVMLKPRGAAPQTGAVT